MMFSVTDKRSFHYIANRVEQIRKEVGDTKPIYIVANKTDLIRFREVSSQGDKLTKPINNIYFMFMYKTIKVIQSSLKNNTL